MVRTGFSRPNPDLSSHGNEAYSFESRFDTVVICREVDLCTGYFDLRIRMAM